MSAQPTSRRSKPRTTPASTTGPKPSLSATTKNQTRSVTPTSVSDRNPSPVYWRSQSQTKENTTTRSNSRSSSTQRPSMKPVPRVEKISLDSAEGAQKRLSTSSVPRGRSRSPSGFLRVYRDNKVSKGESDGRVLSSAGKKNEAKLSKDSKENSVFGAGLSKKTANLSVGSSDSGESEKKAFGIRDANGNCEKSVVLSSNSVKVREICVPGVSNIGSEGAQVVKLDSSKESRDIASRKGSVSESCKDKGLVGAGGNKVGVKHTSELHERLAFLEGKVKRIASDIKRTKEMLDKNNPDASKVMLSDIQNKILGIEKAMGNVVGESSKTDDAEDTMVATKSESEKVADVKSSVKGLNNEELEARLFPHQKLLRNRVVMKGSMGGFQSNDEDGVNDPSDLKAKEKLLNHVDENSVALAFFASVDGEEIKEGASEAFPGCMFQGTEITSILETKNKLTNDNEELLLTAEDTLEDFDDQENNHAIAICEEAHDDRAYQENNHPLIICEEAEENCVDQLRGIGTKISTGGWFLSEGESVLLAHDDGTCSFYDIAHCEEKAVFKPPTGVPPNIWRDCWIIRAPGADGCSNRYVVAASAGSNLTSGFCSWDFYSRDVRAFHVEDEVTSASRSLDGLLPNNPTYRRNALSSESKDSPQWWYRPCGPLIISTASSEKGVKIFDVRDGEQMMKWEVSRPVSAMDYSSPLQWRNKGKVVIAESETISVWDVNSLSPQSLFSISTSGQRISSLHVVNSDAESGGGVRQRVSSAEAEGNDGVFCTANFINVLDFRQPSGIGFKIPKLGVTAQAVFTRGDLIYIGCYNTRSTTQSGSQIQQFSVRKQRLVSTYLLPESHSQLPIAQVWGNSNLVMGVSGQGLFMFDAADVDTTQSLTNGYGNNTQHVKEVVATNDLCAPSFDYLSSRVLLISGDRPAQWRYLS